MPDCKVMLNNIDIYSNRMRVDLAVVCGYDDVEPKIRAIFRRDDEIRRIPVLTKGIFRRKEQNDTVVICSYTYLPSYIFTKESDEEISLSFEIAFGDECFEDVPFFVSNGIADEKGVDAKYLAPDIFNGATVFNSPFYKRFSDDESDVSYDYKPEPENSRVILFKVDSGCNDESKIKRFLFAVCSQLMGIVNLILCLCLMPYFIIDGILAGLGFVRTHRYNAGEGLPARIVGQIKTNIASFLKSTFKDEAIAMKFVQPRNAILFRYYKRMCKKPVKKNQITFISGRRDELSGNEKFVFDIIKDRKDIDFKFLMMNSVDEFRRFGNTKKFFKLYATSKVVIVDDFFNLLNLVEKREDVTLFQLWHACGAFKTFGFSRIGKPGGPKQTAPHHRMYDYATVSSEEIVKYYAEGFGISDKNVLATGVPRTDIFFDDEYANSVKEGFYSRHPEFKNKKIILFAPTFRGNGQKGAFYPLNVFNPAEFLKNIGEDYAMIIKLHPFCSERYEIDPSVAGRLIDLSDEDELNDLLFVTDLLVTDYSSAVFEASLLNIPMLFYPYDLYQYISERDFYCDFVSFVPGKIAFTQKDMEKAVADGNFETEKIEPFKNKFFSHADGKSSQRVADAILSALEN